MSRQPLENRRPQRVVHHEGPARRVLHPHADSLRHLARHRPVREVLRQILDRPVELFDADLPGLGPFGELADPFGVCELGGGEAGQRERDIVAEWRTEALALIGKMTDA